MSAPGYRNLVEPPRHPVRVTTDGEPDLRYATSDHPKVWDGVAHREHTFIRCGVCGYDSCDWGRNRRTHVQMGHEHHFQTSHVGTKVVWRAEDVVDETLNDLSEMSRFRHRDSVEAEYVGAYRGDASDEQIRELVDDDVYVVVHQPPSKAYPDSPEAGATESLYLLDGGDTE